jgi:AcrR family transcriptional regulator
MTQASTGARRAAEGHDRSEATRAQLLDTAIDLFSRRGVYNVSLAEIVRRANQRNLSALHYHFGGRDALLKAIMDRYVPTIRDRRLELLEFARQSPTHDIRSPIEALVRPITELAQTGWRERGYLVISAELATGPDQSEPLIQEMFRQTAGLEVRDLLRARLPLLADDAFGTRFQICSMVAGRAASDRARMRAYETPGSSMLEGDDAFADNLVAMLTGAMLAEPPAAPGPRTARPTR